MPEPQHLLVLVGLPVAPKATLAATLAHALHADGRTVTLLDNSDRRLRLDFPTVRLPAGCVCCTVAGRLFPAVAQVTTDMALLVASAQARLHLRPRALCQQVQVSERRQQPFRARTRRLHLRKKTSSGKGK
jgi:hypothetical protein